MSKSEVWMHMVTHREDPDDTHYVESAEAARAFIRRQERPGDWHYHTFPVPVPIDYRKLGVLGPDDPEPDEESEREGMRVPEND